MTRRYLRTTLDPFQRVHVPLLEFPTGEGPPFYVSTTQGVWRRLGLGEGTLVSFEGEGGGGAFAWGMTNSRVFVWIRAAAAGGRAYCLHAGLGPLDPASVTRALRALECEAAPERQELYVVVASRQAVSAADETAIRAHGVRQERIFTYSGCFLTQFGVSANGCVGEAM